MIIERRFFNESRAKPSKPFNFFNIPYHRFANLKIEYMNQFKKIITFSLVCFYFLSCQNNQTESTKTATEEFAALADAPGFNESHDEPKNRSLEELGEMVKIPVSQGEQANAYLLKNENPTNKYLLVIHEWWGLNNHIKAEADQWFEKLGDVNVIALDLYDGKVATTREKAQEYMQGADENRIESIIKGVLDYIDKDAEVATIGWCFGGGWSLRTALLAGNKTKACVMYYGMPVDDEEKLAGMNSEVLFIYGKKDQWINESVASKFEENMKNVGKNIKVLPFDADHAFANPSSERFNEAAAKEANAAAYDFLSSLF